ncbi:protein Aster-B isoform X10 [Drosophila elegans]|nr:protein Aster-B isoform X10 [Drosophila elegans]
MLFRVWQNTLMNKQFSPQEIWKHVHTCYGEELGLTTDDEDYIDPTLDNDNETDFDFQTAIDEDSQSQRQSQQSNQSNQSTQSNPQLPQSGNSSASSGGGIRASAPRKSKTKYFFNSSKSSANASASGSDNNKTRESSRKLNKKMKQNAKELILSSVKPTELSVSVTMGAPNASSSSTAGSTTASSSTIANLTGSGSGSGSLSGSNTAAASGSGSEKKIAEKRISTASNSAAIAAAAPSASMATATSSGAPATESKLETKRKLGKLHRQREDGKNAVESVPTDVSDSSDSEENNLPFVPTTECTSTHEGRQIVHTILPINVDTLFNMLFSKSKFITDFHAMRKSTDLVLGEWTRNEEGLLGRTVNVTVQLAASVGPKTSKVTEYQVQRECSKPGELYSIDVNSINAGIPYADSFSVLIHFCLARTVDDHTMLSIHTQIKYKKSIWGVVKGFIEKNTWAGVEDFFGAQLHALQSETCIPPAKGKGRRPRRGMNQQSVTATATPISTSTAMGAIQHTATTTDNDSIQESAKRHLQQNEHHQHQHLHMHHHHHHHHGSQHHHQHHHDPRHSLSHHHHHPHQHQHPHPHWHQRKAILPSSRGTASQIRPLEEPVGPLPTGDPLEAQMLATGVVAGAAVGASAGHPLLLEGGKKQQQQQQLHHHHQHHLQPHKHHKQQQQLHLGGGDDQTLATGQGPQGHRFRHKGLWLLVILLLCLMLALNVILLLKLWKLEERIDVDLNRRARLPSLAALSELPSTNQEWLQMLRDQEMAHENELHKWKQVLQTAIELLKKVSIVCEKIYNDGQLRQSIESMSMAVHTEF